MRQATERGNKNEKNYEAVLRLTVALKTMFTGEIKAANLDAGIEA